MGIILLGLKADSTRIKFLLHQFFLGHFFPSHDFFLGLMDIGEKWGGVLGKC